MKVFLAILCHCGRVYTMKINNNITNEIAEVAATLFRYNATVDTADRKAFEKAVFPHVLTVMDGEGSIAHRLVADVAWLDSVIETYTAIRAAN